MPAKGISVCPIPTLVEKRWVFVIFWMGIRRTLHYTSASRAKSSIFFSLGTQEWLVWHSQGLPDTFRVARYLPMVEMTRKRQEKGPFSEKKNEKMAVMRLSIECQKIPSYGSMATLRPFHFWEKPRFKS